MSVFLLRYKPRFLLLRSNRMKTVEETEAVKLKLIKDAMTKKRKLEEVVHFNQDILRDMGPNYVEHHRCRHFVHSEPL